MLFGRKKPGFVIEEAVSAEAGAAGTVPAEGTGAAPVESAVAARGGAVAPVEGAAAALRTGAVPVEGVAAARGGAVALAPTGKQDLLTYIESLPEDGVEDGLGAEGAAVEPELTKAQQLAEYIRLRTKGAVLTAAKQLQEEVEGFDELKSQWVDDETCQDIVIVKGEKDHYYYSNLHMSNNYAMIASLVEEKDLPRTIATMVRFNCKTYPAPTPYAYFERSPYFATSAQIQRAQTVMGSAQQYQDVKTLANNQGDLFFYSTIHMSGKYAQALADVELYTD